MAVVYHTLPDYRLLSSEPHKVVLKSLWPRPMQNVIINDENIGQ